MREVSEWMELKRIVPSYLKKICQLCYEFYEQMNYMETILPGVNAFDIQKVQSKIEQIMAEYIKIIRANVVNKEDLQQILDDINKSMSAFFDMKGRIRPLTTEFRLAQKEGDTDDHFFLFFAPFTAFIDARILDSLREAKSYVKKTWVVKFVDSTTKKGGLYPDYNEDRGFSMKPKHKGSEDIVLV